VQAACPQCAHKVLIDDAKVPDRPFSVKCPKCGNTIKLPGKAGAAAPEPALGSEPAGTASGGVEEMRAQMMAQIRREMTGAGPAPTGGRALVALPDRALAGNLTLVLTRQGLTVDTLDVEEGARLLEQGIYEVVVTARTAGAGGKESLYQRINRLSGDGRRRIFLILAGDEFKSGDGTQAFAVLADLVLHSRDAATADALVRGTLAERGRVYRTFLDAKQRHEAAAG
jgi:predicted Zn finger-like uncharacterized protein